MTATAKLAVIGGITLTLALAAAAYLSQQLRAERTAHEATKREYAQGKALWLADQRSANATITGLQGQASALFINRDADQQAEFDRFQIFLNGLAPQEKGQSDENAVDAAEKAVVQHINRAFARSGSLHGAGE